MEAIKKKMQAMETEKGNAMEQTARDTNARADRTEEEVQTLTNIIKKIEAEYAIAQEALKQALANLELQAVIRTQFH
jgi:tRNA C32,U32 (ribose-2'-O)-methylase TrmJ